MRWSRSEQAAALLVAWAAISGSVVLLLIRRPPPPVQLIEQLPASEVVVQVDGEVLRPGLYHLPQGARVGDAIRAAGGPGTAADMSVINLARLLHDGDRVTVPARSRVPGTVPRALSLNAAGEGDLVSLPGIGPVLAQRIVEYRRRHGPFRRVEDLLQVEGIGPRLLERLRPLITVE